MSEEAPGRTLYVLVGPTASGKTSIAQWIAEQRGAAVLSADSMLIYKGMDIGTAKPEQTTRGCVPYLGMDLAEPHETFSVWHYRQSVVSQLAELPVAQDVIVVGGSGLYVKALITGLDRAGEEPVARRQWETLFAEQGVEGLQTALRQQNPRLLATLADARNPRRLIRALERREDVWPPPDAKEHEAGGSVIAATPVLAGLWVEPVLLNSRIARRVEEMYAAGLLEEVAGLLAMEPGFSPTARQAIGYAEAIAVLEGRCSRAEAMEKTAIRTRQLAKRQRTWFRHQAQVQWVNVSEEDSVESIAGRVQKIWETYENAKLA